MSIFEELWLDDLPDPQISFTIEYDSQQVLEPGQPVTQSSDFVLSNFKWAGGGNGVAGGQVTWSFATLLNVNNRLAFDTTLSSFLPAGFEDEVRRAFDAWEAVANIDFVEVSDSGIVDIRLGGNFIDGGSGTVGTAFTTFFPGQIVNVDIQFDTAENWTLGTTSGSTIGFFEVATHEIGHAIGMGHENDVAAIMNAFIGGATNLTTDDINAAVTIYGAAAGTTTTLETLVTGDDIFGTDDADQLTGTTLGELITLNSGDDFVFALDGNDTVDGGDGDDIIDAGGGDDQVVGGAGNDSLSGGLGDDWIDGGDGIDVGFFTGFHTSYTIDREGTLLTVLGLEGTDSLVNVESLSFMDGTVRFDTDGNAGDVFRLYQAAFNRTPDTDGLSFWVNAADNGVDLADIGIAFIGSGEFASAFGENLSNAGLVDLLFQNVLGRAGDEGGIAFWNGVLDDGALSQAGVLQAFSESGENVNLVAAAINDGIFVNFF